MSEKNTDLTDLMMKFCWELFFSEGIWRSVSVTALVFPLFLFHNVAPNSRNEFVYLRNQQRRHSFSF